MGADEAGVITTLGFNGTLGLLGSAFARLPQGRRGLQPEGCFFLMNNFYLFLWLCWVFFVALGFSLVCGERGLLSSCSAQASH